MHDKDFDHSKPLTGKKPYSEDPYIKTWEIQCDDKGYKKYLRKWKAQKSYWRDVKSAEYQERLGYFKDSCLIIQYTNAMKAMKLEFTFYADWSPSEFEDLIQSQVEYRGLQLSDYEIEIEHKNVNYRYLMPSMDPCEMNPSLRSVVSKPSNFSVSWAFAITNSIEYEIKKQYLEEYDQIVEVSLSAQELIDCAPESMGQDSVDMGGLSLLTGFGYAISYGLAYSEFYPYTHTMGQCRNVTADHKFFIESYERSEVYNKLGLFKLMAEGPVAVLMGLNPKYFQFYRSDRSQGPYLSTAYGSPSVYGVLVEYSQFAEGSDEYSSNPYFAVETRLRGCDSFVFRLPILDSTDDSNIGGIAGYAIRPVLNITAILPPAEPTTAAPTAKPTTVAPTTAAPTTVAPTTVAPPTVPPTTAAPTVQPTTAAPTIPPTPEPTPEPTPTPTPTPEPWFPIYDPFIFGDNCNYVEETTCKNDFLSDIDIVKRYLALRDAYPKQALMTSRVLALAGVNFEAVELFRESLSKQEKNPANVDMYFYSDSKLGHYIDSDVAVPLISLAEFTRPRIIMFGEGSLKLEDMAAILQWMVDNREEGYFKNLAEFQISGHDLSSYDCTDEEAADLQAQIIGNLTILCNDHNNFPALNLLNFDDNGLSQDRDQFAKDIVSACSTNYKSVSVVDYPAYYRPMCSDTYSNLWYYYTNSNEIEVRQCRFTWNWEVVQSNTMYAPAGPFSLENAPDC